MDRLPVPDEIRERLASLAAKAATLPQDAPGVCPACLGSGWLEIARVASRCECSAPVAAEGVPYEFNDARLDNYREDDGNRTALAKARAFLAGTRDLFLTGGVGAGKTRLACSVLNEHAAGRRTALFANVPMMLHRLQPGRDEGDYEGLLMSVSLLVLDDLGAERDVATDYTRRTLYMIYEARHANRLRTIFTSNKSIQEIADMHDDTRLASRLTGRADAVRLKTPDQRMLRRVK